MGLLNEQNYRKYSEDSQELRDALKGLDQDKTYTGSKKGSCITINDKEIEFCNIVTDRGWHNGVIQITRTGPDNDFTIKICKLDDCDSYWNTVTFTEESTYGSISPAEEEMGGSSVLSEQLYVNGQEVSREEWVDYQIRNYMHISIDKTFKDEFIEKLTELEKEQYCRLLPPVFDPEEDWDMFDDEPFEGDTSPCEE